MALSALITGCVSFLPTYDETVHAKLEAALVEINKVGAAVALDPQPSFERIEPYYIGALGNLRAAESTAEGSAYNYRGSLAARSAQIVASAIRNCRVAVEATMAEHRRAGLTATDFEASSLTQICGISTTMQERLKR